MESILREKIIYYFEKNNITKDSQHGFRNKERRRLFLPTLTFLCWLQFAV